MQDVKHLLCNHFPLEILVLGAGGTGSHALPHMLRQLRNLPAGCPYIMTVADGDSVEQKNLVRQNFVEPDLGKNKAEVIVTRYAASFSLFDNVFACPRYIESISAIDDAFRSMEELARPRPSFYIRMIVTLVDNHRSRQLVHEYVNSWHSSPIFWLDAGNEEFTGHVSLGFRENNYAMFNPPLFNLPLVTEIYPDILQVKSRFNSQLSCAELAESSPQTIMANVTAATLINVFFSQVLRGDIVSHHATFNAVTGVVRTTFNTEESLGEKINAVQAA